MALTPRLELRQGQHLVMTPQLQQAIKLLQLSNLDLAVYVDQELERNPLLERLDGEAEPHVNGHDAPSPPEPAGDQPLIALDQKLSQQDASGAAAELDTDYDNLYADDTKADRDIAAPPADLGSWANVRTSAGGRFEDGENLLETTVASQTNLRDHLTAQLSGADFCPTRRMIAAFLVDMVNEAGYLMGDIAEVADKLGTTPDEVEAVLKAVQDFDPPGVGARTLAECLAIQLREQRRLDPFMERLLANLDLLARKDISSLLKACECDSEDLAEMIREVRLLNPKPGLAFGHEVVQPVVPDVFVRVASEGSWAVELNSETLPRVLVNARYYTSVDRVNSRETKAYLTDCLNNANWLVKSLDQRAKTILKVASEIVRQQDSFLALGVAHLRPLNLRTVADAISMHESTVSRVTANKYMSTPRGVFELKYFFTSAIQAVDGGESHSAEAVRHRIRQLIGAEPADNVLSDDRIVELLKTAGIDIARRTVAKYREGMGIPSSVQRRRVNRVDA
jgi:RNA polymerase sigma-54 factor